MLDSLNNQIPMDPTQLPGTPDSGQMPMDPMLTQDPAAAPETPAEPPLTRAEIAAMFEQKLNEFKTSQHSAQQKAEARIKKELQTQLESLKRAGVELSPEQARALTDETRARITQEETGGQEPTAGGKMPESQGGPPPATVETVNAMANELVQEYGFGLDPATDAEEIKMIDQGSPAKFIRSLERALEAKKARLDGQKQQREAKPGARTPMMAGGSTPGNPIASINDIDALYEMARGKRR